MGLRNIIAARDQSQNSQGQPLSGGKVFLYEPGTTTFIQTFQDSGLVTPFVNPIKLSGSGRVNIWINRDCDLRLEDRNGNLILTEQNVNPEALGQLVTGGLISNGGFELDTDADGTPDGWDLLSEVGATNARDISESTEGVASFRFTSSGIGGGSLTTTTFFPVNDVDDLHINLDIRSTLATVRNIVRIEWYDVSQVSISDSDIYDSTNNPLTYTSQSLTGNPPALARFAKLRLIGIDPSVALAGSTFFDRVEVFYPASVQGIFDNIEIRNNEIITTNTNGDLELNPNGTGIVNITAPLTVTGLVNITAPLTVTGLFTSIGIQDLATAERLQIEDTILILGTASFEHYTLHYADDDGQLQLSGGSSRNAGGNIILKGEAHATNAGDMLLRSSTNLWTRWDESVGQLEISTGIGAKTRALTLDANQNALFVGLIEVEKSGGGANDFLHLRDSTDTADLVFRYNGTNFEIRTEAAGSGVSSINFLQNGDIVFPGTVTVQGAFTSLGIDDNATGPMLLIADTSISFGPDDATEYPLKRTSTDGLLTITGSNNANLGANINLFGNNHAVQGSDMTFQADANVWMRFDESVGDLEILTGIGAKTSALIIDASQKGIWAADMSIAGDLSIAGELQIEAYSEDADSYGLGGAITLNTALATYFHPTGALTSIPTFTFSNPAASGRATSFTMELNNGANFAPVWPASVDWAGGVEPTWSSSIDVVGFSSRDNGTTWLGFLGGLNFS